MLKTMTNRDIYKYYNLLEEFYFEDDKKIYLPSKINFYFQKNKQNIYYACGLIFKIRQEICEKYGIFNEEENCYNFSEEDIKTVNKELDNLLDINQDIDIQKIKLSDLEGLEFTLEQMEALMFMIEED